MARAKKKAKARAKAKPRAQAAPKAAARGKSKSGNTEVEKRWSEYWRCRKDLEDAVERVRTARETLNQAQELERTKRGEFEAVKRTLTELLDVEPASGPRLVPTPNESKQGLS